MSQEKQQIIATEMFWSSSELADIFVIEHKIHKTIKDFSRRNKDNIGFFLDMIETTQGDIELALYGLYLSCIGKPNTVASYI